MSNVVTGYIKNGAGVITDSIQLDLDNYVHTLGYTGANLTSDSITQQMFYNGTKQTLTFTQTLTYTGANLTGASAWLAVGT